MPRTARRVVRARARACSRVDPRSGRGVFRLLQRARAPETCERPSRGRSRERSRAGSAAFAMGLAPVAARSVVRGRHRRAAACGRSRVAAIPSAGRCREHVTHSGAAARRERDTRRQAESRTAGRGRTHCVASRRGPSDCGARGCQRSSLARVESHGRRRVRTGAGPASHRGGAQRAAGGVRSWCTRRGQATRDAERVWRHRPEDRGSHAMEHHPEVVRHASTAGRPDRAAGARSRARTDQRCARVAGRRRRARQECEAARRTARS